MITGVAYYWEDEGGFSYVCEGRCKESSTGKKITMGFAHNVASIIANLESSFGHCGFELKPISKYQRETLFDQ